jgi:hypothetical protein
MLEEGVRDHRHECMTMKALPGSSLEMIETEFFFQLLVSLLANPSRLDVRNVPLSRTTGSSNRPLRSVFPRCRGATSACCPALRSQGRREAGRWTKSL